MRADSGFSVERSESVLDLGLLDVTKRIIASSEGESFERVVIEHPGAVAVVPLVDDHVVLIKQYRAACDRSILEIPAGRLDVEDKSNEDAARRELLEETGYTAVTLTHLTDILTSVGFCDERIHIFIAEGVRAGERRPVGEEEIGAEVILIPFEEAIELVLSGEIEDSKTVIGLLLAARDDVSP